MQHEIEKPLNNQGLKKRETEHEIRGTSACENRKAA